MHTEPGGDVSRQPTERLFNLDYLRGAAAFSIMIYHYFSWSYGKYDANTAMSRIGVYGVSLFYILSGLTLYHVYFNKLDASTSGLTDFFKKRFFRIYPLMWLVIILNLMVTIRVPQAQKLLLNLSGLFGFVSWDSYYAVGLWSIGNELVFYVFFPVFVLLMKFSRPAMVILGIMVLALYVYFAFYRLSPDLTLSEQWRDYVNPLNQVFLFMSGFFMGHFFKSQKVNPLIVLTILLIGLAVFVFYPATGDRISLVTGIPRIIFTVVCLMICFSFFKLKIPLPHYLHHPLTKLGESSYSVYLLHPIIWKLFYYFSRGSREYLSIEIPQWILITVAGITSLYVSYLVYMKYEKYCQRLGRKNFNLPLKFR
jgi:exopolysaccharide production protein ExoZ